MVASTSEHEVFERARLSRDPRFDGRFFVGVRTTGIYCRPVCPANAPKRENVEFYPSAAAASEAGFRPCLRCRPEAAPGTPAWIGTSTTVRRGLRLIESGALDDEGVDELAERLGVTSRHLRRLFQKHVGASPLAVAQTQRLHFAKRLIDETSLPLTEIALAAGFGSVRRFNDLFRKTYDRPPRELRRRAGDTSGSALAIRLPYRPPFDWEQAHGFFVFRATPGVEAVDEDSYVRSISHDGETGAIRVRHLPDECALSVSVHGVPTGALFTVVQRVRSMFDVDAPVAEIESLLARDDKLRPIIENQRGTRVPGVWDGFELAVRAILGQQVSVKGATTLAGRVAKRYGEPVRIAGASEVDRLFPTPDRLRRARFNNMGLIGNRIKSIRALAAAVHRGDISLSEDADPAETMRELVKLHGIGEWTAQYIAMRALKDPDAFPAADLGLIRAIDPERRIKPAELESMAEAWRPWRAYAALLLWRKSAGG